MLRALQQVEGKAHQKEVDSGGPAAVSRPLHPPANVHPSQPAVHPSPAAAQPLTEKISYPPKFRAGALTPDTARGKWCFLQSVTKIFSCFISGWTLLKYVQCPTCSFFYYTLCKGNMKHYFKFSQLQHSSCSEGKHDVLKQALK